MTSKHSSRFSSALLVLTGLLTSTTVRGQMASSSVTQCNAQYSWAVNTLDQTPCLVAAYLTSVCGGAPVVTALPPNTHYEGPDAQHAEDICQCSSVVYSLFSACALCQNRTYLNFTTWSANCTSVEVTSYPEPIPNQTQVPPWAYLNVTATNHNFDPILAQSIANSTSPGPSLTKSISLISTVTSAASALNTSTSVTGSGSISSASSSQHSSAGAIAGGVVGGIVFLAVVALLSFWYWRTRRTKDSHARPIILDENEGPGLSLMREQFSGPPTNASSPPYIYNSSDTNDAPISPVTSGVYTTMYSRASVEENQSYQASHPAARGYSGAAEL